MLMSSSKEGKGAGSLRSRLDHNPKGHKLLEAFTRIHEGVMRHKTTHRPMDADTTADKIVAGLYVNHMMHIDPIIQHSLKIR